MKPKIKNWLKNQRKTVEATSEVLEFLHESNLIESERSGLALLDAAKAWGYISKKKTLKVLDILTVHDLLMKNLNPRIAGRIRNVSVWIGGKPGANPASVSYLLDDLVKIVPKNWKEIKRWHIDFEGIHPFEDSNGRTGRIIMNWQRKKNGLPILIIHHGEEQSEYYQWFNEK